MNFRDYVYKKKEWTDDGILYSFVYGSEFNRWQDKVSKEEYDKCSLPELKYSLEDKIKKESDNKFIEQQMKYLTHITAIIFGMLLLFLIQNLIGLIELEIKMACMGI